MKRLFGWATNLKFLGVLYRLKNLLFTWGLVIAISMLSLKKMKPIYHDIEYVCAFFFPIGYWPLRMWIEYSFWPAAVFGIFWIAYRVHVSQILESFQDQIQSLVIQARAVQDGMLLKAAQIEKNNLEKDEEIQALTLELNDLKSKKSKKKVEEN